MAIMSETFTTRGYIELKVPKHDGEFSPPTVFERYQRKPPALRDMFRAFRHVKVSKIVKGNLLMVEPDGQRMAEPFTLRYELSLFDTDVLTFLVLKAPKILILSI
jgi:hypothetical protein